MHWYWTTLRKNRKTGHWWNRGADMVCVITTKCNLHCDYCLMFLTDNKYPRFEECGLDEWKHFFEVFPEWLSQIYISGGEPSLVPWVPDLVNWLIDRGHHVIVFTNLQNPETFYRIKKSFRFVLVPTYHKSDDPSRFQDALDKLEGRFRIMVQEMEEKHTFSFSKHKNKFKRSWLLEENTHLHAAPDSPRTWKLYLGCNRVYMDGKKWGPKQ